ncbi:MAG TPA: TRAP transporter small permease subunit [Burkholderiales bacterium]|jgi:TRAP-type mannitol/chloroaromatic compound transport system permease small subunit
MRDFPPVCYAIIRAIDRFSDATGKLISLSMLWLVASISYECFSRYLLNAPTIWVLESSYMTNGSAFMLGCAYALHKGAHVRTDMLWEKFSERRKGIIDLTSYLLLFYPTLVILMAISIDDAVYSFSIGEESEQTAWRPVMWPFRAAVPLAALLLMIQGVSESLKCWYQIRFGREFEQRAKVEV